MRSLNADEAQLRTSAAHARRKIAEAESSFVAITVGELVSLRARTHGPKIAINLFERGEQATYSEMDRWSNKYANALEAFGVRNGDRVAVMLPNRIEFPLLWFAFAKLGAVLVPINMRYTPREIEYVLADTSVSFAVVDATAWSVFSSIDAWPQSLSRERVILVGDGASDDLVTLDNLLMTSTDAPIEREVSPSDLLNIQFTSGTTGFPKGCMLTHDYWAVSWCGSVLQDPEPCSRYLSWQAFLYVDAQMQLLRSYWQGGTLYLASRMSSSNFMSWLIDHQIEWCAFPELVTRQPEASTDGSTSLKLVHHQGGWSAGSMHRFRARYGVLGHNNYGSTEIGWGTIVPGIVHEDGASFGLRAPFRSLRLINEDGSATPVGGTGELWVSGRGIFKGYWNKPDANAELFEGEWFKTGDLMRCDENGFYWLVGRTKEMIRRSGENIAAREVEAVIREIPEVEDVAAVPIKDSTRGEEVKIYVELKSGLSKQDLSAEQIIDHARGRLAVFKVPRYVSFISALPRSSSSNKVLKRELMEIESPFEGTYDSSEGRWL